MASENHRILRRDFIKGLAVLPVLSCFPFAIKADIEKNPWKDEKKYSWTGSMRNEHPRLFINKTSFPRVKARAQNEEQEIFGEKKNRVDQLFNKKIEFQNPLE